MENVSPIDEPRSVQSQASAWLAKLDSDQPSVQDLQDFKQWVNQHPAHISAFKQVTAAWDELNLLTRLPLELEQRQTHASQTAPKEPRGIANWGRGLAFATVLLVTLVTLLPDWLAPDQGQYHTAVGEQTTITLPDNSVVQLNTNTRLTMDYSGTDRALYLLQGEAHFEVAHNPERPFNVYVGTGLVRAVGTAFSVHLSENDIGVIVTEGVVEIEPEVVATTATNINTATTTDSAAPTQSAPTTEPSQRLAAGKAAVFDQHQIKHIQSIPPQEMQQRLAWQRGLIIFSDEPLERVIAQISRYTDINIVIKSEELRQLRIGGQFQVDDTRAIFRALEKGFGLKAEYATNQLVYLSVKE